LRRALRDARDGHRFIGGGFIARANRPTELPQLFREPPPALRSEL